MIVLILFNMTRVKANLLHWAQGHNFVSCGTGYGYSLLNLVTGLVHGLIGLGMNLPWFCILNEDSTVKKIRYPV